MKKYILSLIIILSLSVFIFILLKDEEQSYPYITVHTDTLQSTETCESRVEYTIQGSGYFNIGFIGYKLERKVFLGWKEIDIVSMIYTMPLVKYPYESSICTTNALESGKYRITTIMRESSTHDAITATFEIE